MKPDNLLLVIACVAVVISVVSTGINYYSIASLSSKVSGLATGAGEVNLTVETLAQVNFSKNIIDWGSGMVDSGKTFAELNSIAGTANATNGNWSLVYGDGLVLDNDGNVDLVLNLTSSKTLDNFIGGTNPAYEWNVSNKEAGSCVNSTPLGYFLNVTSYNGTEFCSNFSFTSGQDTIRIDVNLTIPENSKTGALSDVITAVFNQVA